MVKISNFIMMISRAALLSNTIFHNGSRSISSLAFAFNTGISTSTHTRTSISTSSRKSHIHHSVLQRSSQLNKVHHVLSHRTTTTTSTTKLSSSSQQIQQTLAVIEDNHYDEDGNPITYYQAEQVIKRSRFIGIAKHCTSWEEAKVFIESIRKVHPKSRHACFGFVCGCNPVTERCSDDGEPTGTAGPPILGGINGDELSDTVCVVVRYSGGIKLGAGGLIRAYGGTARLVLRAADKAILIPKSQINVCTSSSFAGSLYSTATKHGGVVEGENYKDNGDIQATIICDTENFDAMVEDLRDATRGGITFETNAGTED